LFCILITFTPNANVFSGANTALSTQIFSNAQQPYIGAQARAWGAALTLVAIAFIVLIAARLATARFSRHSR
jgi:phosphate transport system permease protein